MIRSILVHLDSDRHALARMRFAIALARQQGAHLSGLAATGLLVLPGTVPVQAAAGELAQLLWDELRQKSEEDGRFFAEECRAAGLADFESVLDEDDKTTSLIRHSRCCDLVVLSQADPDAPGYAASRSLIERVMLESARPVLLLPYAGELPASAKNVLVAWDDSREAARALADAVPILQDAGRVQIVTWVDPSEGDVRYFETRLACVQAWLKRHGIVAQVQVDVADRIAVGEAALSRAADFGADLLVMGAYGHSRWAERLLGGVTRGILKSMTVPVLMSH